MDIILYMLFGIVGFIVLLTFAEITILILKKPAKEFPDKGESGHYASFPDGRKFEELYMFLEGDDSAPFFSEADTYEMLLRQCRYIEKRFDCADFRCQLLFKIYKDCGEKLSDRCRALIKNTFLGFKYFMDEPGDDSMCFWSENHQIMFAVAEYLAGQEWPQEKFTNNGMTGEEHRQKAAERIEIWMRHRFNYGFSEYLSNNYLVEDISPMANYIAYCRDKESADRMKIIMDILWLDVALNSVNNRFVAVSSRMYGNNKAGNFYGNSIQSAMNVLWGRETAEKLQNNSHLPESENVLIRLSAEKTPNHILICFTDIVKKGIYTLPEAIKDIALYKERFVSKMSCGLSPEDMEKEELIGKNPEGIMALWGAETFTNPQAIETTLKYVKENKLYRNAFIGYFKFLNITVLRFLNWRKFAERHNIMPHGIATGRGNVYTYRTPHYMLSTAVNNAVGMCGAQDHVWTADIGENLTLFTTHPAGNGKGRYGSSPGYWIGNGRRPQSVQYKNVNITIYKLPEKVRLGETAISDITHAYMPKCFYDEFILSGNMVFARKNGVFVALISDGELSFRPFDADSLNGLLKNKSFPCELVPTGEFDLIRRGGMYHTYITELSDETAESFGEFMERIMKNETRFSGNGSVYCKTQSGALAVSYDGEFTLDGKKQNTEYYRYDSIFCHAPRKAEKIKVNSEKNSLLLDFENIIRKEGSGEENVRID